MLQINDPENPIEGEGEAWRGSGLVRTHIHRVTYAARRVTVSQM